MHSRLSLAHEKFRRATKSDNGYAVAEFAITVPALVAISSICFWVVGVSVNKFQIDNYANQAARTIARGETLSDEFLASGPKGMAITLNENENKIRVDVQLIKTIPLLNRTIELSSTAESISEVYEFQE